MTRPAFNWNDLRFFLAVARSHTISRAGRRTGADHATVGRRISALEQALGLKLFERNFRGYNLTKQGENLLAVATSIESEATKIEELAAGQQHGLAGAVRISAPEGFGNFFLASQIGALATAYPRLSIEMITIQQIVALSRREADIAITMTLPTAGNFTHEHLTDYRLHIYGSKTYLASTLPIVSPEDLDRHPFIGYVDDLIFTRALNYLPEIRPHLRARIQNSSIQAQMTAAVSGFGLCVLPDYVARTQPELTAVLTNSISLSRTYWMVTSADIAETSLVKLTRRFLRELIIESGDFFASGSLLP